MIEKLIKMNYETIGDIYAANALIRQRLLDMLADMVDASKRADGWSVSEVVEHLSMVEGGVLRICARLIDAAKATGRPGDGRVSLSDVFIEQWRAAGSAKIEAPERVRPTGTQTIAESLEKLTESRAGFDALRADVESLDLSEHKFPHPVFGDLTATEWLVLLGGHEARHTAQIERILSIRENAATAPAS